jgi:phosphate uptake regulator
MKRSIIQLGGKTYVVSLPLHWIEKQGLQKKDLVNVVEIGEELIIRTETSKINKRIDFKIDFKNKKLLRNLFLILGSLGYDEVNIKFDDQGMIPFIHEIAHEYSGFALVEQTKDKCIYRIVLKEDKEDFDYLLGKCFDVTLSLATSFTEMVSDGKFSATESLISLEKTNNQLSTLCQRILIKNGYKDSDKICFMYVLVWNLEIIADFYRRSCEFVSQLKTNKLNNKTIESLEMTKILMEKLVELSKNIDIDLFIEIFDRKEKIGDGIDEVFKKGKFEDIVMGHYIMDIVTYIQDCAVVYLGVFSGKMEDRKLKSKTDM